MIISDLHIDHITTTNERGSKYETQAYSSGNDKRVNFCRGWSYLAYDPHTDEATERAAQALAHGQDGHAEQAVENPEEALKHAQISNEAP
jgi:Small metal-binding protein